MTAGSSTFEVLCCEAGAQLFGVRADQTATVARAEDVIQSSLIPGAVGILRHRGRDVPVAPLAARFGLTTTSTGWGHVVVTRSGDELQGWLVTRVLRRAMAASQDLASLPDLLGEEPRQLFDGLLSTQDQWMLTLAVGPRAVDAVVAGPTRVSVADLLDRRASAQDRRHSQALHPLIVFETDALSLPAGVMPALGASQVCEVLPEPRIVPVPCAPRGILGVLPWRGRAVPVVDLVGQSGQAITKALIAQERRDTAEPTLIAIPIHGDARLLRVPDAESTSVPGFGAVSTLHGVFVVGGGTVGVINVGAVAASALGPVTRSAVP